MFLKWLKLGYPGIMAIMDWNQISEGLGYGLWLCFIAVAGQIFYWLGEHRYEDRPLAKSRRGEMINKIKTITEGFVVAAILGLIASGDYIHREGGDYLFDPGEVVEVAENKEPQKSFASMFVFTSICWACGALTKKD